MLYFLLVLSLSVIINNQRSVEVVDVLACFRVSGALFFSGLHLRISAHLLFGYWIFQLSVHREILINRSEYFNTI